jgi:hypothetical protein
MDFYEYNRQFNGGGQGDENYDYKVKSVPQMYPQMPQMPAMANMMPSIVPVPMMAIRPGAELEYNRWLNSGGYPPPYRGNYYDGNTYPRASGGHNGHHDAEHSDRRAYPDDADLSPGYSTANSPRFGPGPPIVTSDRVKGPRGCNLFVFHLPNEITNWDLYLLFRKYGTILSVHTMINKTTGLSKGYGFVSYSSRDEAKAAITAMDGFRLGKKRLKVQVKRSQDDLMEGAEGFDEQEEEEELEDHLYEGQGFTSGENSAVTTRASTPHATQPKPTPLPAMGSNSSHCSSDSLDEQEHEHTKGHHPQAHSQQSQQRAQEDSAALRESTHALGALSMTPVTPKQAEAMHKREAYVAPGGAGTRAHGTTTATHTSATYTSAHHTPTHAHMTAHTHASPRATLQRQTAGTGSRDFNQVASAPTPSGQYEPEIGARKVTGVELG